MCEWGFRFIQPVCFFFRFAESFTYLPIIAVCKSLCARSCIFTACFFSIKCNIRPIKPMLNKLKPKIRAYILSPFVAKITWTLHLICLWNNGYLQKKLFITCVFNMCLLTSFFLTQKAIFALMKLFLIVADLVKHKWTIETNCMCTDIFSVCRQIKILSCTCMLNTLLNMFKYGDIIAIKFGV